MKCTGKGLAGKLPPNYAACLIEIPEGCSCCPAGHYFEPAADDDAQKSARKAAKLEMHLLEKYRRKGWTEEKIKRALADKRKTENRYASEWPPPKDEAGRVARALQETVSAFSLPIYLCI